MEQNVLLEQTPQSSIEAKRKKTFYALSKCNRKTWMLTLSVLEVQIAEFASSVDLDEMAHNEPCHLDIHCLPCSL